MKLLKYGLCLLLAACLCSACAGRQAAGDGGDDVPELPAETEANNEGNLLAQMDAVYALFDVSPLPLKGPETYAALDSYDGGSQFVQEDETAKMLARAIYNLLDAYGNGLGIYEPDSISMEKTTTALFHTAPIDFSWEMGREGEFSCDAPNHILAALVKRELESGRTPVAVYYADEVHKTAQRLFGPDARITDGDEQPYYYYAKEGVYLLTENLGAATAVPQILSYQKTENGYQAEAVLVYREEGTGGDLGSGLSYNAQGLNKENFAQVTASAPRLQYVFRQDGENLILESLTTRRPE